MKKRLLVLFALGLTIVPGFAASAATLTPERVGAISQQCTVIQTILDQLQRRDLVARTNRGRAYEAQIKQIDALSQRLHANNIASTSIDAPAVNFKAVVESFRGAYVTYDDSMTTLRQIDCRNRPEDFALRLEESKVHRHALGVEVTKGEEALTRYRQAVTLLRETLPEDKRSGSQ
ncbi:MAG TPA: hypothetical protein VJM32_00295 [Candidatus Saccharimonadales bacterium]|nr:hypothetical protein [Candidatus Saccharimonadales bacterium]